MSKRGSGINVGTFPPFTRLSFKHLPAKTSCRFNHYSLSGCLGMLPVALLDAEICRAWACWLQEGLVQKNPKPEAKVPFVSQASTENNKKELEFKEDGQELRSRCFKGSMKNSANNRNRRSIKSKIILLGFGFNSRVCVCVCV